MNGNAHWASLMADWVLLCLAYLYFIVYLQHFFFIPELIAPRDGLGAIVNALTIGCGLGFCYERCRKPSLHRPLDLILLFAFSLAVGQITYSYFTNP